MTYPSLLRRPIMRLLSCLAATSQSVAAAGLVARLPTATQFESAMGDCWTDQRRIAVEVTLQFARDSCSQRHGLRQRVTESLDTRCNLRPPCFHSSPHCEI